MKNIKKINIKILIKKIHKNSTSGIGLNKLFQIDK